MLIRDDGEWCRYENYDALKARLESVSAQRNTVTNVLRDTQARLAEAERDAKRYRHIRNNVNAVRLLTWQTTPEYLDKEIDRQLAANSAGEKS